MLRLPSVIDSVARDEEARQDFGPKWRPAVDGIVAEWQERGNIDVSRLTQEWPPELASEMAALALEGEQFGRCRLRQDGRRLSGALAAQALQGAETRSDALAIRAAEEQSDEKAKRERILEWQDLVRKERQLERPKLEPKTTIR